MSKYSHLRIWELTKFVFFLKKKNSQNISYQNDYVENLFIFCQSADSIIEQLFQL